MATYTAPFSLYLIYKYFKKIITGLDELNEHDIADLDMQGDIYEYMLGKLSVAGQNGQSCTSKHIREMMVELIISKFIKYFHEIYGDKPDKFIEEDGRKCFLIYLRPIINGVENYYIEACTRDNRRMDVVMTT